jgi:ATP-dependent DNA ligase
MIGIEVGGLDNELETWYGAIMMTEMFPVCMLAEKLSEHRSAIKSWPKIWAEPKLDGVRLRFYRINGVFRAFTRPSRNLPNGTEYTHHLTHIINELPKDVDNYIADCEAFTDGWGNTLSLLRTGNLKPEVRQHLRAHLIDFANIEAVIVKSRDPIPLFERRVQVEDVASGRKFIEPVKYRVLATEAELDAYYEEVLEDGYEGLVLKNPLSGYYSSRMVDWLKMKPVDDGEGIIIGFSPGKGRNEGRLGAVWLDFDGAKIKCGGGFRDKERDWIWQHRDQLIGRFVEFKYQKDDVAVGRFNRFRRIRWEMGRDTLLAAAFKQAGGRGILEKAA